MSLFAITSFNCNRFAAFNKILWLIQRNNCSPFPTSAHGESFFFANGQDALYMLTLKCIFAKLPLKYLIFATISATLSKNFPLLTKKAITAQAFAWQRSIHLPAPSMTSVILLNSFAFYVVTSACWMCLHVMLRDPRIPRGHGYFRVLSSLTSLFYGVHKQTIFILIQFFSQNTL